VTDRRLSNLIKDSGYAGSAGQSFNSNVVGTSGAGTAMIDYNLDGWSSFSGDPSYPTIHQSGEVYRIQWNAMAGGSRWPFIQHVSAITIQDVDADPAPAEIVAVHEKADAGDVWWVDVRLHGKAGSSANWTDINWSLQIPGDVNGYNSALVHNFTARIVNRGTVGGGGGYPPEHYPLSLSIADNGDGSATGSWLNTDQDALTTGIRIEWQSLSGGVWTTFDQTNLPKTALNHTETLIANGTVVRFRVIYFNANGDSSWGYATSGQVTVTGSASPPTETPSSVSLSNTGGGNARASWANTNSTDLIQVDFYKDSELFGSVQLPANSTQADKNGYTSSTEADCFVYYYNGGGSGPQAAGGPTFF
jgi:hypothetical protein